MTREELLANAVRITGADLALMKRRNTDYAPPDDALRNLEDQATEADETVYQALMGHAGGKLSRVRNSLFYSQDFFADGAQKTILDNLSDIRNYLTLLQIYYEDQRRQHDDDETLIENDTDATPTPTLWDRLTSLLQR